MIRIPVTHRIDRAGRAEPNEVQHSQRMAVALLGFAGPCRLIPHTTEKTQG
jgi:hypothetical protein